MTEADASLEAWTYLKPRLNERQQRVLDAIKALGEANDRAVAERLGVPINCVTPRRGELARKRLVAPTRVDKCAYSGHASQYWRAT